jgi:dTDP-4-amino-4,6-dideoxygalactose transaminase
MPEMATSKLQMVDLLTQYRKIKSEIDGAIADVLESGQYILGKVVGEFECDVAGYLAVKHAIGCASGTDALQIALMAIDIKPGDEVITTPFTFVATTETIVLLGAKPVYVDIDPVSYNIDPLRLEDAITSRTKAILPVHLYGHSADMDPIMAVARKHGLFVIEDAAQAMGTEYKGRKVGGIGTIGCISFFPSKNLGAFGDAGMVVTNDDQLAQKARIIALHGSRIRYRHEMLGINSRLDSIQAAILKVKLRHLDAWHEARRNAAAVYHRLFQGSAVLLPSEAPYTSHIYHQYTIRLKGRDEVAKHLASEGIPHAIYYPIPLHLQEAYARLGGRRGDFPISEKAADEVLSLPMHTELAEDQQAQIAQAVIGGLKKR